MAMTTTLEAGRPPQQLRDDLWLFPPNRDSQGGSSWWLDLDPEPVLVDCPPLTEASLTALRQLAAGGLSPAQCGAVGHLCRGTHHGEWFAAVVDAGADAGELCGVRPGTK